MRARRSAGPVELLVVAAATIWSQRAAADTADEVISALDALSNTSAVVEGRVASHAYTFDPAAGPRTVATLTDVRTHFGGFRDKTLRVATLGGPISRKRWLFIPELPRLTASTRYLLFLTNVDWFYTPVVGNYVFRLERGPQGADILIEPSGHAVVGVSASGLQVTRDPVVEDKLDFLMPHARPRLVESSRSQLARAISKDRFLTTIRSLIQETPVRGELRSRPAAGRVWNRSTAARAPSSDAAAHRPARNDLVCVDPGPDAKRCRDSRDNNPAKEK